MLHKKSIIIADGYIGVDWGTILKKINKSNIEAVNISEFYKDDSAIKKLVKPYLTDDPFFGKVYQGTIEDFIDLSKLKKFLAENKSKNILLYGPGAYNFATKKHTKTLYYADLIPKEFIARTRDGKTKPVGYKGKAKELSRNAPAYLSTKRFHYIDFPVLDKQRKETIKNADFYIDANDEKKPKLVPIETYNKTIEELYTKPFRPIPHYDPAPWGGQWLRRARNLKIDAPNLGWSYDLIAPDVAIETKAGKNKIKIPFVNIVEHAPKTLMGPYVTKKFDDHWPIRVNYDDTLDDKVKEHGMGIHVHPDTKYVKKNFKEKWGQQESYYMLATGQGAKVYLGLKDEANLEEFRKKAKEAEDGKPFDYEKYINGFEAKEGDLFLIPTGTVHSGKNVVVLEISATTVRYTLRIYDYLRPDLDGRMRHIATHHAFRAIDPNKRTNWIKKNLIQKPRQKRQGKGWAEYTIGRHKDIFFEVRRVEFKKQYPDETKDRFHLLTLAKGKSVKIVPDSNPKNAFNLNLSETVIIPAAIGKYKVEGKNVENHIVKSMVR